MFLSLKRLMKASLTHYMKHTRTEWVLCHPNQIILAVSQIMWAKGIHEILDHAAAKNCQKKLEEFEENCIKVNKII